MRGLKKIGPRWIIRGQALGIPQMDKMDAIAQLLYKVRGVEIWDLVSALARIVRIPDAAEQTTIRMDETPMAVHQDRIRQRLRNSERVEFSSLFEGEKIQSRIVGIFQAILELIRHEQYRALQENEGGEIWIMPPTTQAAKLTTP